MQEELDPNRREYRFAVPKLLYVDSATSGAPINIGTSPAELLQRLAPRVGPTDSIAAGWVNQIFNSEDRFAGQSSESDYTGQPMKWKFSTYEMVTTIRGQSQYTQLQNSSMRCIDEFTDQAILSFNLPLPANDHAEWHASQTESLESFRRPRGQIVDENEFLQQYLRAFETQLDQVTRQLGAHLLDVVLPFTYRDRQGRLWNAIWEERCWLTDQGGFCHAARKIHLISPRCARAMQVKHLSGLAGMIVTTGQAVLEQPLYSSAQPGTSAFPYPGLSSFSQAPPPSPQLPLYPTTAVSVVRGMEIQAASATLPRSVKDASDMAQTMKERAPSSSSQQLYSLAQPPPPPSPQLPRYPPTLIPIVGGTEIQAATQDEWETPIMEEFFDFDGLFVPEDRVSKRRATLSNCLDLSAPHTHPSCSERQGLVPNRNDEFSEVQEPRVSNTSIAAQGPTPDADGNHGIEMHSSIPNFGTRNSTGVQLAAASPMKASTPPHPPGYRPSRVLLLQLESADSCGSGA